MNPLPFSHSGPQESLAIETPLNSSKNALEEQFIHGEGMPKAFRIPESCNPFATGEASISEFTVSYNQPANFLSSAFSMQPASLHSNGVSEDESQLFTDYKDLPNYSQAIDVSAVVKRLYELFGDLGDDKNVFDAIDNLRILNKYYTRELNSILINFWSSILNALQHSSSLVVRNSLVLLSEVFKNASIERLLDEVVSGLVPIVLAKAALSKSIIRSEAKEVLRELATNCCYDSTVTTLCFQVCSDSIEVSDLAVRTLAQLLNSIGENISRLHSSTLMTLMRTLASTIKSVKAPHTSKIAETVCVYICKLHGVEGYSNLLSNSNLDQESYMTLFQAIQGKKGLPERSGITKKQKPTQLNSSWNLNSMPNPDGFFANLEPLSTDPGVIHGLYRKNITAPFKTSVPTTNLVNFTGFQPQQSSQFPGSTTMIPQWDLLSQRESLNCNREAH